MQPNWTKLKRKLANTFPFLNFIEYAFLRAAMALINFFPISVSIWITRRIGDIMFLILPSRRRVALENLTIAFGNSKSDSEKRRLALESFRHLITSFMEFFRLPKFVKVSAKHVRFKNTKCLDRALAKGKGAILVMSHLGCWEYLGFLVYLKKYPTTILARAIRNPYIDRWVKNLRKTVNLKHSDKDLNPRWIFSELRQNHCVGIAIDQWAGNEGLWIDFFATPTSTTSLPADMAKRTGCAIVPIYCIRVASGEYEILVEPEVPVKEDENNWVENATKELNYRLEKNIRAFPEQWMWTHKRWKRKMHIKVPVRSGI